MQNYLGKAFPLALQHVFAMFGATVLVPFLTGCLLVALFTSGIGMIFIFTREGACLFGLIFAFIAPLAMQQKIILTVRSYGRCHDRRLGVFACLFNYQDFGSDLFIAMYQCGGRPGSYIIGLCRHG